MNNPKAKSLTANDVLTPPVNIRARKPALLRLRLLHAERCLKFAYEHEARSSRTSDDTLHLAKLREFVIYVVKTLAHHDRDPHAKVVLDELTTLMKWWSAQPQNAGVGSLLVQ